MSSKQEQVVKTIDGSEAKRSECRHIKGEFYKVGDPKVKDSGQCFEINGRFYRLSTGYIVYDEFNKEYVLNNDSIKSGVVGIDDKGALVMGHFTPNPLKNVTLIDAQGMAYIVIDEAILARTREYRYDKSRDRYAHISTQNAQDFITLRQIDSNYKHSLHYDCREIIGQYTADFDKSELEISDNIRSNADALDGLTFGLEFETVRGVVPDRVTRSLGLIPLRDGSIEGLEYATIPLQGAKGLQAAIESCKALERFTKFDNSCSLHLHMGGIPRTEEYLTALFKVLCLIQDEFFEMFPIYKKYNFGVKRKNYTQPFNAISMMNQFDKVITKENIKENFDVIYRFLSRGQTYREVGNDLSKVKGHPSDPRGTSKWNITSRYYWVNLIPIVFGNKQTVEFRIHTPTTDYNKVLNYIYICGAVLNYTKRFQGDILLNRVGATLTLSDVVIRGLKGGNDNLIDCVLDYISCRKQGTSRDNHDGNIRGEEKNISSGYYDWAKSKKTKSARRSPGIVDQIEVDDDFVWRTLGNMPDFNAPPRPIRRTGGNTAQMEAQRRIHELLMQEQQARRAAQATTIGGIGGVERAGRIDPSDLPRFFAGLDPDINVVDSDGSSEGW